MGRTFVSLYSGCGGMDLGFINAGYKCIAAYDFDTDAVENHKANLACPIFQRDLKDNCDDIVDTVRKADVLLAGPPCQGFSTAGKNLINDARNEHLINVVDIAVRALPEVVIIENVRGLLGGRYRNYFESAVGQLTNAGYFVSTTVADASQFGVPQLRKRVLVMASRTKQIENLTAENLPPSTIRTALSNLVNADNHTVKNIPENSSSYLIAKCISQGQKLSNVRGGDNAVHTWQIPEVFGAVTVFEGKLLDGIMRFRRQLRVREFGDADPVSISLLTKEFGSKAATSIQALIAKKYLKKVGRKIDLTHGFNGKFRRLSWDKPSLTVDTRFGQHRYFLHPEEHRGFTVREAARIQGFPDTYKFVSSEHASYRMIGNAVPPPLAFAVAKTVSKHLS
jgi:DNA (cytosine-5)-methyltransferase 1